MELSHDQKRVIRDMRDALKVFVLDPHIQAALAQFDPKANDQGYQALRTWNMWDMDRVLLLGAPSDFRHDAPMAAPVPCTDYGPDPARLISLLGRAADFVEGEADSGELEPDSEEYDSIIYALWTDLRGAADQLKAGAAR